MPAVTGPALVAAVLLVLAGAQKLLDPVMTVGALRALRLPSSEALVRSGAAAELALGTAAIALGGIVVWWLVALSYVAFAAFVGAALRAGTMIGSCGCFGKEDTPPHPLHLVLDVGLAAVAVTAALSTSGALVDELLDHPGQGAAVTLLAMAGVYLLHAAFVELPRTLAAGRASR